MKGKKTFIASRDLDLVWLELPSTKVHMIHGLWSSSSSWSCCWCKNDLVEWRKTKKLCQKKGDLALTSWFRDIFFNQEERWHLGQICKSIQRDWVPNLNTEELRNRRTKVPRTFACPVWWISQGSKCTAASPSPPPSFFLALVQSRVRRSRISFTAESSSSISILKQQRQQQNQSVRAEIDWVNTGWRLSNGRKLKKSNQCKEIEKEGEENEKKSNGFFHFFSFVAAFSCASKLKNKAVFFSYLFLVHVWLGHVFCEVDERGRHETRQN